MKSRFCRGCGVNIIGNTWAEVNTHTPEECAKFKADIAWMKSPEGQKQMARAQARFFRRQKGK